MREKSVSASAGLTGTVNSGGGAAALGCADDRSGGATSASELGVPKMQPRQASPAMARPVMVPSAG